MPICHSILIAFALTNISNGNVARVNRSLVCRLFDIDLFLLEAKGMTCRLWYHYRMYAKDIGFFINMVTQAHGFA